MDGRARRMAQRENEDDAWEETLISSPAETNTSQHVPRNTSYEKLGDKHYERARHLERRQSLP